MYVWLLVALDFVARGCLAKFGDGEFVLVLRISPNFRWRLDFVLAPYDSRSTSPLNWSLASDFCRSGCRMCRNYIDKIENLNPQRGVY